ncbi:MAG: gliding motility-associated C-terminal domain-containing protein [Bacteroidota bacterium]
MTSTITKTYTTISLFVLFCSSASALHVTILESQSFHPAQTMDLNWYNAALVLGHDAQIETYDFLDDACNLRHTDILVVSSGLIDLSATQSAHIKEFVRLGGQLYLQSEYLFTHAGNLTFKYLVDELGGQFNWTGQGAGQQVPMQVESPLRDNYNTVDQLNYFWYGTYGNGDGTIRPFLRYQDRSYGFIYESPNPAHGKIVTSSDQDWIRNYSNPLLLENILKYLEGQAHTGLLPAVSISSSSEQPCTGEIVTFHADILNYHPGVALQWTINGQAVNGAHGTVFQTDDLQDGDVVECVLELEQLCNTHRHVSNPILIAIIVPVASPELELVVERVEYCTGQDIFFNASTENGLAGLSDISYEWFVNGQAQNVNNNFFVINTLSDRDVVHCEMSFQRPCLGLGAVATQGVAVDITTSLDPSIQLLATAEVLCEGDLVHFTAVGENLGPNPRYEWRIDGELQPLTGPILSADDLRDGQIVTLTANSSAPCVTSSSVVATPIRMSVLPILSPTASLHTESDSICAGEAAHFEIVGQHLEAASYEWSVNGHRIGPDAPVFSSTTLQDGAEVRCRVRLTGPCTTTDLLEPAAIKMQVSNLNTPQLEIDASAERVCPGASVQFTATGEYWGSAPVFQWRLNDSLLAHTEADIRLSDYRAHYQLRATVISNDRCLRIDRAEFTAPMPAVQPLQLEVIDNNPERCQRADGWVEVAIDGGFEPLQYTWSNGATTSYLTDLTAGDYALTVSDELGCTATVRTEVDAAAGPQIVDVQTSPALCERVTGTAKLVLATENESHTYTWYQQNGEVLDATSTEVVLPHGWFSVEVRDEYGCVERRDFEVERNSPVEVALNEDFEIRLGDRVALDALVNVNTDLEYQWTASTEEKICDDCTTNEVQPTEHTTYRVVVSDEYGCTATDEVEVRVLPNRDLFIPNVFSPNGDGQNDYFMVYGGANLVSVARMQIFDRWGATLYDRKNLTPNAEGEGWDGLYQGQALGQGVFVYVIELEFLDGERRVVHGDVSLF